MARTKRQSYSEQFKRQFIVHVETANNKTRILVKEGIIIKAEPILNWCVGTSFSWFIQQIGPRRWKIKTAPYGEEML